MSEDRDLNLPFFGYGFVFGLGVAGYHFFIETLTQGWFLLAAFAWVINWFIWLGMVFQDYETKTFDLICGWLTSIFMFIGILKAFFIREAPIPVPWYW